MTIETLVGFRNELPVKPFLLDSSLVTGHEKNGFAIRIKGEEDTPDAAIDFAPQLLHVRVLGSLECIGMRPTEAWTLSLEKTGLNQDRILDGHRTHIKLHLEVIEEIDDPIHGTI